MEKILVPVDGSEASMKAAAKAAEIAEKNKAKLTFITVSINPIPSKVYEYEPFWDPEINEMLEIIKRIDGKMLDDVISKLNLEGIPYDRVFCLGFAYEEILKTAEEGNYDLIVMGRRGFSKVKRFFIGSVTQKVIADAPCPVLIINE
ncbi:MAG: universal stress protein [Sedimentibacter sp.]|uniref:universal stress protein n=1 Tax=Sedimentibacter sp. TaxID=1960295 RepID=UPI003158752E